MPKETLTAWRLGFVKRCVTVHSRHSHFPIRALRGMGKLILGSGLSSFLICARRGTVYGDTLPPGREIVSPRKRPMSALQANGLFRRHIYSVMMTLK